MLGILKSKDLKKTQSQTLFFVLIAENFGTLRFKALKFKSDFLKLLCSCALNFLLLGIPFRFDFKKSVQICVKILSLGLAYCTCRLARICLYFFGGGV